MNMSAGIGRHGEVPRLQVFQGIWSIVRDIRDNRAGEDLSFRGEARFDPGAGGLLYSEVGFLLLPQGGRVDARRRFIFREGVSGLEVLFEDGRPFHCIPRSIDAPSATHWCNPDSYFVRYDFSSWPIWTAHWQVRGPRKHYRTETRYTPAQR